VTSEIPDHLPEDLRPRSLAEFVDDLQDFCLKSSLTVTEIVGALESVKFILMHDRVEAAKADDERDGG
jgi:hypothetical protein